MKLFAAPFVALLLPLSACSVVENIADAPSYDPNTLYLTNGMPVHVRGEYLERYACAADVPLMCECSGRVNKDCDCHC